jgi:uncharacterized membrane protein YfcA
VSSSEIFLLFGAALIAGALNSIAGGGSFLSFPLLLFLGIPSVQANASNTVSLWPGTLASTGAYRKSLSRDLVRRILPLAVSAVAGSLVGAWLLLHTRQRTFDKLVPWLLLSGTLLFCARHKVSGWVSGSQQSREPSGKTVAWITLVQGLLGIYIGYFGAGVGIVMLPLLLLMGIDNIHSMSGVRTLVVTCGNGVAVALFIAAHAVRWPIVLVMTLGAVVGGYAGAHFAQKMQPKTVGYSVIAIGFAMSAYFFGKTYL